MSIGVQIGVGAKSTGLCIHIDWEILLAFLIEWFGGGCKRKEGLREVWLEI